jgi:uncharacterized protein
MHSNFSIHSDMYLRILNKYIPKNASFFLFGPRQTGKTTCLGQIPHSLKRDFLNNDHFVTYTANSELLYEEVQTIKDQAGCVWLDEVQRVPLVLETVQRCMGSFPHIQFILSGSSARKLKRGAANLLGGRALYLELHPLTIQELGNDYQLDSVLRYGSLPHISNLLAQGDEKLAQQFLRSYVLTYLAEEIQAEAIVRQLTHFLSLLATKAGVSQHFVREYFSILEDTLIGFLLPAYAESERKKMSKQPKFYLFDNGITRAIQQRASQLPSPDERGVLFEQFVILEIKRMIAYEAPELSLAFWRSAAGAEVDILITRGSEILAAIECKVSDTLAKSDLSGLRAFRACHRLVPLFVCCPASQTRITEDAITIVNPKKLWELIQLLS